MSTVTVDTTLIERPTVYGNTGTSYNVAEIIIPNIPTEAGSGAGADVTITVDCSEANLEESLNYCIQAIPSQACAVSYDNKATDSFDIVLTPLSGSTTLAEGTLDVIVTWPRG
jgi:hypothetical protein